MNLSLPFAFIFVFAVSNLTAQDLSKETILIDGKRVTVLVDEDGFIEKVLTAAQAEHLSKLQYKVDLENANRGLLAISDGETLIASSSSITNTTQSSTGNTVIEEDTEEQISEVFVEQELSTSNVLAIAPENVEFFGDNTALNEEIIASLDEFVEKLASQPAWRLKLTTFDYASGGSNRKIIANDRLERCKEYVVEKGVDRDKIQLVVQDGSIKLQNTLRISIFE